MSTSQSKNLKRLYFMNLALQQAYKNLGNTNENPSVGCVLVKNNCVVSGACTSINGRPHAESIAIKNSRDKLSGTHLYVTLEPCSHYGKTAPCANLIVKKKISKVFYSIKDPDKRSFHKSKIKFKNNKIISGEGLLSNRVKKFYSSYIKSKNNSLPFVTAKIALSKDLYSKNIKKKWITNKFSRGRVHLMRSQHDCLLTSSNTIIEDNPKLTCRINGLENLSPTRIVLDKDLKIPINSYLVKSSKKNKIIVFFNKTNNKKINLLSSYNIKFIKTSVYDENLDLRKILIKLKKLGYYRIFLEAGLNLTTSFLSYNLVDVMQIFISNQKIKNNGRNSFKKNFNTFFNERKFINKKVNLFGDRLISYNIK